MYLRVTRGRWDPAKHDELAPLAPEAIAAIRRLPGCLDARSGVDRSTGRTISVSSFDTLEHAQFSRDSLGEVVARLQAGGWQAEPPDIYETIEEANGRSPARPPTSRLVATFTQETAPRRVLAP